MKDEQLYDAVDDTQQEMMVIFTIRFEGEEEIRKLTFTEEDINTILNYDRILKKILQAYRYKMQGKHLVSLSIENFYRGSNLRIPIHNPQNYSYLIGDMVGRRQGSTDINIYVSKTGELTKRKQREKAIPIQFDSDGSIEQAENEGVSKCVLANTPKCEPYRSSAAVRCIFCHKSSRDSEGRRVSGPFYGPFINKSFAHLMCLLWCSVVYLDEQSELKRVPEAIKNSKNMKCRYCLQKGASTYCHTEQCRKAAHYQCATDNNWHFDWTIYKTYCPDCTANEQTAIEQSRTRTITQRNARNEANIEQERQE